MARGRPPRGALSPVARDGRDDRVAEVLSDAVAGEEGRWLLVGLDPGSPVGDALADASVELWNRWALGGRPASAAPPDGPFDGVALRLPRGQDAIRMTLHLLAARLAPGGRVVVGGANDEGAKSLGPRLGEVFEQIEDHGGRRHCRVWSAAAPVASARGDLADWAETVELDAPGGALRLASWPGLFAHGRLDEGTRRLLAVLPDLTGAAVLDYACGAGVLARAAIDRHGATSVDASDVDALAVYATSRNVPEARVHLADGWPPGGPWDTILSNPPLHRGNDTDLGAFRALMEGAPARLRRGGALWMVTQATVPVRGLTPAGATATRLQGSDGRFDLWRVTAR